MELELAGTVALVRGVDGAIGAAVADRLSACGAHVVGSGTVADLVGARGGLDILVNAEPSLLDSEAEAPLAAMQSAMDACAAAADAMVDGRIVNIGSVFGLVPARGEGGRIAGASAALFAQTRALALSLAPRGILLNALAILDTLRPHTPLGRVAHPREVANAVLFLLAAESGYVVGEILRLDGGWSSGYAREF